MKEYKVPPKNFITVFGHLVSKDQTIRAQCVFCCTERQATAQNFVDEGWKASYVSKNPYCRRCAATSQKSCTKEFFSVRDCIGCKATYQCTAETNVTLLSCPSCPEVPIITTNQSHSNQGDTWDLGIAFAPTDLGRVANERDFLSKENIKLRAQFEQVQAELFAAKQYAAELDNLNRVRKPVWERLEDFGYAILREGIPQFSTVLTTSIENATGRKCQIALFDPRDFEIKKITKVLAEQMKQQSSVEDVVKATKYYSETKNNVLEELRRETERVMQESPPLEDIERFMEDNNIKDFKINVANGLFAEHVKNYVRACLETAITRLKVRY